MAKFGFVLHPLSIEDIKSHIGFTRYLPDSLVEWAGKYASPYIASHVTGVRSLTGKEVDGWFAVVPMTPKMMMQDQDYAVKQIIKAGKLLESRCSNHGLRSYTSVVKDAGISIAKHWI